MWFTLMGLPGALQTVDDNVDTLLTRLSATKSGYLDAAISSRAAASIWTSGLATKIDTLHDSRLTVGRATNLDNLDALVSEAGAKPPMVGGLKGVVTANADIISMNSSFLAFTRNFPAVTATETLLNTWQTLRSVTGSGIIELLNIYQTVNASSKNIQARLKIDGNIVWTSGTDCWNGSSDDDDGICLIGSVVFEFAADNLPSIVTFGSIPFKTSFLLEFQNTESASTITMGSICKWHETS